MPALEVTEYSYPQHSYVSLSIPIRYAYCFCVVAYGVLCIAGVSCNMSLMHCLHVRVAQSCRKVSCARMAQSQRSLGALPPEITIMSFNVGLQNSHLNIENPYLYTFTQAFVLDLQDFFRVQGAHGLFLCEMGSQKPGQSIDHSFSTRFAKHLQAPREQELWQFCNRSASLGEYLALALEAAGLSHLQAYSFPPYAYIGDPQFLSVSPPEKFQAHPAGNKERFGVWYATTYIPTGDHFPVISLHSPSSGIWDKLKPHKKETILRNCVDLARRQLRRIETPGAAPPMWIICGDLNIALGSMLQWKTQIENDAKPEHTSSSSDPEQRHIHIHLAKWGADQNQHGDLMLSQGFATIHVESTIGCSAKSRKHATDGHDAVNFSGHRMTMQTPRAKHMPSPRRTRPAATDKNSSDASSLAEHASVATVHTPGASSTTLPQTQRNHTNPARQPKQSTDYSSKSATVSKQASDAPPLAADSTPDSAASKWDHRYSTWQQTQSTDSSTRSATVNKQASDAPPLAADPTPESSAVDDSWPALPRHRAYTEHQALATANKQPSEAPPLADKATSSAIHTPGASSSSTPQSHRKQISEVPSGADQRALSTANLQIEDIERRAEQGTITDEDVMREVEAMHGTHGTLLKPEDYEAPLRPYLGSDASPLAAHSIVDRSVGPTGDSDAWLSLPRLGGGTMQIALDTGNAQMFYVKDDKNIREYNEESPRESDALPLAADSPNALLAALANDAEGDTHSEAADSMLQTMHGWPEQGRGMDDVIGMAHTLLHIRRTIVPRMAEKAAQRSPRWSVEEWFNYLDNSDFDRGQMNDAIEIWRDEIYAREMAEQCAQRVKDTSSDKQRRSIMRSGFRAWLKEKYGHANLAKCFLKYPLAQYNQLLAAWGEYTRTREYQDARERHLARELRTQVSCSPQTDEASDNQFTSAPLRGRGSIHYQDLDRLRQQRKAAIKGKADAVTMQWFLSGDLDKELERVTKEHGSGRYWDEAGNPVDLRPWAFEDFVERQR